MCDRDQLDSMDQKQGLNRRQFAMLGAVGLASCGTHVSGDNTAHANALAEDMVRITTPDGSMDAFFVRPAEGTHPAIVTWPDIAGLRDAFKMMARRLAGQGYAVIVVNPYYRTGPAPMFADFADFLANDGFAVASIMREALTPDAIMRDAKAAIGWLDARVEVDADKGVGTHGYCMGGSFTIFTAAAVPGRVRAAASLHGGGLVKEADPQSPHKLLKQTQAAYLIAIGQNDDAKAPQDKISFRSAADAAGRPAEIEVYQADHGWTVLDSPSYYKPEAERAWAAMSDLFARSL